MSDKPETFELDFGVNRIRIEEVRIPSQTLFRVNFSNSIPPLTLLRATNAEQKRFWTSMPEGRQKLAEQIGPLIETYYRSKMK